MYNDDKDIEENEETEVQESFFQRNKKMIIILAVFLLVIIFLMIISGGSENSGEKPKEKEATLTLMYNGEELQENSEVIITKNGTDYVNAFNEENNGVGITWTSSDEKIATVDSISGNVNGVSSGTVTITATYKKEGMEPKVKSYQLKVIEGGNINSKLQGITSVGNALIMNIGMTHQVSAKYIPADGYVEKLEYSSTSPVVATVDNTGTVTAYTLGKTTITMKANNDSSLMTQIDVYVISNSMTTPLFGTFAKELRFENTSLKVKVGETKQLKYFKDDEMALDTYMKWTSSDESVATVDDNGLLTAIKEGSTQVTLSTITGVSAVMNVQVEKNVIEVESIGGLSSTITIKVGEYYTITPTVKPDDASNKNLTFTSNNPSVASVNPQSGISTMVYGASKGSAMITVTSDNGKTTTVSVEVTSASSDKPSSGGTGEDCGVDSTKGYKVSSSDQNLNNCKSKALENPSDTCAEIKFTFTNSNTNYLMVCDYKDGESECNPDSGTKITNNSKYKVNRLGMRVIKIKEYRNNSAYKTLKFWYNIASTGSSCSSTGGETSKKVTKITANCSAVSTFSVGNTKTIKVTIEPTGANQNLRYLIGDTNILGLTSGSNGSYTFKGKSAGTTTVQFLSPDGSVSSNLCTITVR